MAEDADWPTRFIVSRTEYERLVQFQDAVLTHIPEVEGHCDSEIYLGCACGWASNEQGPSWAEHLKVGTLVNNPANTANSDLTFSDRASTIRE